MSLPETAAPGVKLSFSALTRLDGVAPGVRDAGPPLHPLAVVPKVGQAVLLPLLPLRLLPLLARGAAARLVLALLLALRRRRRFAGLAVRGLARLGGRRVGRRAVLRGARRRRRRGALARGERLRRGARRARHVGDDWAERAAPTHSTRARRRNGEGAPRSMAAGPGVRSPASKAGASRVVVLGAGKPAPFCGSGWGQQWLQPERPRLCQACLPLAAAAERRARGVPQLGQRMRGVRACVGRLLLLLFLL